MVEEGFGIIGRGLGKRFRKGKWSWICRFKVGFV